MNLTQVDYRKLLHTRWIICGLVVLVLVPCFWVVQKPFHPSPLAKNLYDRVDALKPGDHLLVALDYDPSAIAELNPMAVAIFRHCFDKGIIPVVMTHWPNATDMAEKLLHEAAESAQERLHHPVASGTDYVYLGYRPGGFALILRMGGSIQSAFDKDFYGKPTDSMPALKGVINLKNINLAIDIAAGNTVGWWIAYGSDRFHFPLGAGTTAVQAPDMYPFIQTGQLVGLLGGLRGAADYEQLVETPGTATKAMPAQSAAHILVIVLILITNARLIIGRFRGNRKET